MNKNTRLTVIIPTLNEAKYLPNLLNVLSTQTRLPDEIVVADAGSIDDTVKLAQEYQTLVVRGGMPGAGRNAGARAAHGEVFLFFDADVLPPSDFIELTLEEFEYGGYDVATCPIEALSKDVTDRVLINITNLYIQIITPISPRAPGCCIFARRGIHEIIGGFDETLTMSEDHDYVRRASKHGKFGFLTSARIPVSMRRLDKEGIVSLAIKYFWCEMYALAGKPIRSMPFKYEFAEYHSEKSDKRQVFIDIAKLRKQLGEFENPIMHLSSVCLKKLQQLAEFDHIDISKSTVWSLFNRSDINILERYLQKRLSILREFGTNVVFQWTKLKRVPRDIIRVLNINSLPSIFDADEPDNDDTKP